MKTQAYRSLMSVGNLLLIAGIGALGYSTYGGGGNASALDDWAALEKRRVDGGQEPFPVRYELETNAGRQSSVRAYAPVWQELDRAKPEPTPTVDRQPAEREPRVRRPQDLSEKYELVMVSADPEDPEGSSFVVEPGGGGGQRTLGVGDELDGYEVLEIVVRGQDDDREAVVTVDNQGEKDTIKITRRPRGGTR